MKSLVHRSLAFLLPVLALTAGLLVWEVALFVLLGRGEPLRLAEVGPPLLLDAVLLLPLSWLTLSVAQYHARVRSRLGAAAAGVLLFGALLGPVVVAREAGQRRVAQVGAEAGGRGGGNGRLLCSLRGSDSLASAAVTQEEGVAARVRAGLADALLLQLPMLPLLWLALGRRPFGPGVSFWMRRERPLTLVPLALLVLTCTQAADGGAGPEELARADVRGGKGPRADAGTGEGDGGTGGGDGGIPGGPRTPDGCLTSAPVRTYHVSAIPVVMTLNRFGDHDPEAFMYVLDERIDAVRAGVVPALSVG